MADNFSILYPEIKRVSNNLSVTLMKLIEEQNCNGNLNEFVGLRGERERFWIFQ